MMSLDIDLLDIIYRKSSKMALDVGTNNIGQSLKTLEALFLGKMFGRHRLARIRLSLNVSVVHLFNQLDIFKNRLS